MQDTGKACGT